MTMFHLSEVLLRAQRARFAAAEVERLFLSEPGLDTPQNRARVGATYFTARFDADHFAYLAGRHPAANDPEFQPSVEPA